MTKDRFSFKEAAIWLSLILLLSVAIYISQAFSLSPSLKMLVALAWLVLALVLSFFTRTGKKVLHFAKEAKIELQKIVWPTRQETVQTTLIVIVMVTVLGFILWGIDSSMMWIIRRLTHLG